MRHAWRLTSDWFDSLPALAVFTSSVILLAGVFLAIGQPAEVAIVSALLIGGGSTLGARAGRRRRRRARRRRAPRR
jgi:hypothetical protein